MAFPPLWKIWRELRRIGRQARGLLVAPSYDRFAQMWYDRVQSRAVLDETGRRPLGDRVAVFVLYQPRGLAASTLFTVDHLLSRGWSVVAVSNAPLSSADREALLDRCARVIQRPNVGYDFGAYREGVRRLRATRTPPRKLILMNDSSWFPLREDDTTLDRLEASGADVAGHIFKIESTQKLGRDHIESHLLMLDGDALKQPYMRSFWRDYVMSNDRETTILRGEKGISQAAIQADRPIFSILGRDRMHALLAALPDDELRATLPYVVHHRERDRAFVKGLIAKADAGQPWRHEFLEWVHLTLSNSRQHLVTVTYVDAALRLGQLAFVKKARDRRAQLARLAVLRAEDQGRIAPLAPVVRQEIEAMARAWVPPADINHHPDEPRTADL